MVALDCHWVSWEPSRSLLPSSAPLLTFILDARRMVFHVSLSLSTVHSVIMPHDACDLPLPFATHIIHSAVFSFDRHLSTLQRISGLVLNCSGDTQSRGSPDVCHTGHRMSGELNGGHCQENDKLSKFLHCPAEVTPNFKMSSQKI